MKFGLVPTYEELFEDETPDFNSLIKNIPAKSIIAIVSLINGQIYLNQSDHLIQFKLLEIILKRQPLDVSNQISFKILDIVKFRGIQNISIFSTNLTLEFLHSAIIASNDKVSIRDLTPKEELNIFKAYLISNSEYFEKNQLNKEHDSHIDFYRKNTWPLLLSQQQLNTSYNYFIALVKSKCFFDVFEYDTTYSKYVKYFTNRFNDKNSLSYLFRFAKTLEASQAKTQNKLESFFIKPDKLSTPFFENLEIDLNSYSSKYSNDKKSFTGFKEKPILKFIDNSYLILSWDFLARKIYDGMQFDFYNNSGISKEKNFPSFPSFKQFISEKPIEKYLFKKLINSCFRNSYHIIRFDDGSEKGHPDAYVRNGKKIFLFEIKDSFLPARVIDSNNYDLIKEEIDKKFNTEKPKRKGTYQIAKCIESLLEKPYEDSSYRELNLKPKNINIYPIIIYTDPHYDLPGVGKYLDEKFKSIIKEKGLYENFKSIKNLTFMNIDFLISNIHYFKKKDFRLDKIIDASISEHKRHEKKIKKDSNTDTLFNVNQNFDQLSSKYFKDRFSDDDFVKSLFDELSLDRGL